MNRIKAVAAVAAAILSMGPALTAAWAQSSDIFCQPIECGTFRRLNDADKNRLQDPFFRLVLAKRPDVRRLADIEALIMGTEGKRRLFVVNEEIQSSVQPASRRAAMDFLGKNGAIELGSSVFLSFSFGSKTFPDAPDLEVLAWDDVNGTYNYYKLDGEGASSSSPQVWKLSATSRNIDNLTPKQRAGTCLACHTTGVPIMKELQFPWNNWHSNRSRIDYLQQTAAPSVRWPVVADPHFAVLATGADFENSIIAAITRSHNKRFEQLVTKQTDGKLAVADARRVLRPLFETREINLASARQESGLHPLTGTAQNGPSQPVRIPNSFFLASAVLGNAGINEVNEFQTAATVNSADYKALVEKSGVKITARPTGQVRGDTNFAWFTPEQGFADSNWIAILVDNGVISKAFAAAAAAVDLETPILSKRRAELLEFIPASFTATPGEPHPDALTRAVIAALEAKAPTSGSAAAEFLQTLKETDPVAAVRSRVQAYKDRIAERLAPTADAKIRNAELQRLFGVLIDRRRAVVAHPAFGNLIESEALFPLP